MKEIQCPEILEENELDSFSLFVAGGISNCPEWQKELSAMLEDVDNLTLINPRRSEYDTTNIDLEEEQIKWEYEHLAKADGFIFWFPKETLCPITLFELGKVTGLHPVSTKPLFVGTHHDYERKRDIRWQMLLVRPEVHVIHSLGMLSHQVRQYLKRPV